MNIKKIIPLNLKIWLIEHKNYFNYKLVNKIKKNNKLAKECYINELKEKTISINDDIKIWEKALNFFSIAQYQDAKLTTYFWTEIIVKEKEYTKERDINNPIVICVVKNDLYRIKKFIEHYRKIGVKFFAFLDNGSTDGTYEYLISQEDTEVFRVLTQYSSIKREAWINRIMAYYGFGNWFIVADSDELLIYNKYEEYSVDQLINYFQKRKIDRIRGLMVDVYSKDILFSVSNKETDIYKQFCYFDIDTYEKSETNRFDAYRGGPRERLFKQQICVTKYPIFKLSIGELQGKSHFLFPYFKNKNTLCQVILLHYKFIPTDYEKFLEIANKGNYYNGSEQYKNYINSYINDKEQSFYYERSKKYNNSQSLDDINIYTKIDW